VVLVSVWSFGIDWFGIRFGGRQYLCLCRNRAVVDVCFLCVFLVSVRSVVIGWWCMCVNACIKT
jgi:hypothetical protein